jgi:hypothetical protein
MAARVPGDGHRLIVNHPKLFAHTSLVLLLCSGRKDLVE